MVLGFSKVLKNNDISYEDRVDAYQHFLMIDHRDGEWDTMEHNTDIEITYAELVIEQGDTDKFAHASLLISISQRFSPYKKSPD